MKLAVLDANQRLIGLEDWVEGQDDSPDTIGRPVVVDHCDLPLNGTYKWSPDLQQFIPVGMGFTKPTRAPVSENLVLYRVIRALEKTENAAGPEASVWANWYEANLKRRDEENVERSIKALR